MWIDVIGLAVLAIFILVGLWRGWLAGVLRLGTLLLSYGAAWFAAGALGDTTAVALEVSPWIGSLAAGTGAFVCAFMVLSVICSLVLRGDRARVEEEGGRSVADRLGGGLVGAAQGGVIVLLIGWLAIWLEAAQVLGGEPFSMTQAPASAGPRPVEAPSESMITALTRDVITRTTKATMGDTPEAKIAANLAARPAETLGGLQEVLDSPQVASLQHDELFWQYLSTGAVEQALNRNSFRSIAYDETLRNRLADLGLVSEAARSDPAVFRQSSREVLQEVGPRLQDIRNDPDLQKLATDPQIQAALSSGDTMSLLTNPAFRAFIDRVLAGGGAQN